MASNTFNNSSFTDLEMVSYNQSYKTYQNIVNVLGLLNHASQIIFGVAGIFGGLLDVKVLYHKEFAKPSFIYHKSLVINDLVYSALGVLAMGIIALAYPESDHKATYVYNLLSSYSNFACLTAESIILFMTVDRVIAIWLPLSFDNFNRNSIAIPLSIASVFIGSFYLPELGVEMLVDDGKNFVLTTTNFGKSNFFGNFDEAVYYAELFVVYLLLFLTFIVIMGLCRMQNLSADANTKKKLSLKRQLTILSLSCSIPSVTNCTIYVIRSTVLTGLKVGPDALFFTYEKAMADLTKATIKIVLYEFQVATGIMAHCLHFYVYMWLSANFREKATMILCGKTKVTILSSTQGVSTINTKVKQASEVALNDG